MSYTPFKKKHTLEVRKKESKRIMAQYANRIPIIVERADKSDLVLIDKNKYLTPDKLTAGEFMYVIRKRITLKPEQALFMFAVTAHGNYLLTPQMLLAQTYKENKDEDGFLYITYSSENSFG